MNFLLHQFLITAATPRRVGLYRLMKARAAWTPDQIRTYQEKKLRDVIVYCWQHIPFYREHWRGHIDDPREINTIADLHKLPGAGALHSFGHVIRQAQFTGG
jgi:phenylacetate-CoA ligase